VITSLFGVNLRESENHKGNKEQDYHPLKWCCRPHFNSPPRCASSLTECQQTQQKVKAKAIKASALNAASNPFGPAIRVAAVMGADNSTRQTVSIFLPFIWEKTLVMGAKRGLDDFADFDDLVAVLVVLLRLRAFIV
jgi:hypothetical protein